MADLIDAKTAKAQLGCDDATLSSHINSGALRAQKVDGVLMVNAEDVNRLVAGDDEGTIVLTGDSENLSIDLGKVVDDSSATITSGSAVKRQDESITFGDELEVVSFDDGNTKPLDFSDNQTANKGGPGKSPTLSFTDTNTAVITAVDETQVGVTTGVGQTAVLSTDIDRANDSSISARRSVRSTRVVAEAPPVGALWIVLMILTLIIGLIFTIPYYPLAMWPNGEAKDAAGYTSRGVSQGFYANLAGRSLMAGFSLEPDKEVHDKTGNGNEWIPITQGFLASPETQAEWTRIAEWRHRTWQTIPQEGRPTPVSIDSKIDSLTIQKVSQDGMSATSKGDLKTYKVIDAPVKPGEAPHKMPDPNN